jgi:hypothetical protein
MIELNRPMKMAVATLRRLKASFNPSHLGAALQSSSGIKQCHK